MPLLLLLLMPLLVLVLVVVLLFDAGEEEKKPMPKLCLLSLLARRLFAFGAVLSPARCADADRPRLHHREGLRLLLFALPLEAPTTTSVSPCSCTVACST